MDEIEKIEQKKVMVFSITALATFITAFLWRHDFSLSVFAAIALALLVAGVHGARNLTREPNWSHLQAEARLQGKSITTRSVWLGNLIPGALSAIWLVWWQSAASQETPP